MAWIGVLSDTHNDLYGLQRAFQAFHEYDVSTIFHCGDLTTPETARMFSGFKIIHTIGNMDKKADEIYKVLIDLNPENLSVNSYVGKIEGKNIAAVHGHIHDSRRKLLEEATPDFLFYGHTHTKRDSWTGNCRIINPGTLGGTTLLNQSFCMVDLAQGDVVFVDL